MILHQNLIKQFTLDFCCPEADIISDNNVFTTFTPLEGRRQFFTDNGFTLKCAVVGNKLLFTGNKDIVSECERKYKTASAQWFAEPENIFGLRDMLKTFDRDITLIHPFYTSETISEVAPDSYTVKYFYGDEIEVFRGDKRFDEAFAFCDTAPDMIGVAATDGSEILGMAGASADGEYMWQIGINVFEKGLGRHIGRDLTALAANEVLKKGRLPFYGTALSHLASQRVALGAGFKPAWVEITAK